MDLVKTLSTFVLKLYLDYWPIYSGKFLDDLEIDFGDSAEYFHKISFDNTFSTKDREQWNPRALFYINEINKVNNVLGAVRTQKNQDYLPYNIAYFAFEDLILKRLPAELPQISRFCSIKLVRRLKEETFRARLNLREFYDGSLLDAIEN